MARHVFAVAVLLLGAAALLPTTVAAGAAATQAGALPAGPVTMPEVAHGLLSQLATNAQFTVVERTLARVTSKDPAIQLVHKLQAQGELGDVVSMKVLPPDVADGGGLLVLHRSRCCDPWCRTPGAPPDDPCIEPQPEAPVVLLRGGAIVRRYLAGRIHLPHSVVVSQDRRSFYCVDRHDAVAIRVDLNTGREIATYGTRWPIAAMRAGVSPTMLDALHRRAIAAFGPSALYYPASVADTADGRVFVGSGYRDQRIVVFNGTTQAALAEVFRAPPLSLEAVDALVTAGSGGDPRGPVDGNKGVRVKPQKWQAACRGRGVGGGTACDTNVSAWVEQVAASHSTSPFLGVAEAVAAGQGAETGVAPRQEQQRGGVPQATRHYALNTAGEWGWQLPHALYIDERRRRLYVANRNRPAIEVIDLETYKLQCTYTLLPVVGSDTVAMSLAEEPSSGRLFVGVDSAHTPLSGAVVELNPRVCGETFAVYPTPVGGFPQHDLDVQARPNGGVAFYISAQPPQAWVLPPLAVGGGHRAARAVGALLEMQVASLMVLGLLMPLAYAVLLLARGAARFCLGNRGRCMFPWLPRSQRWRRLSMGQGTADDDSGLHSADCNGNERVELVVRRGSLTQPSRRQLLASPPFLPGIDENTAAGLEPTRAYTLGTEDEAGLLSPTAWQRGPSLPGSFTSVRLASGTAAVSPFLALSGRAESQLLIAALAARSFTAAAAHSSGTAPLGTAAAGGGGGGGPTPQTHLPAGQEGPAPGAVYFIRHGESTSNERGVLAGVFDVNLTRYGQLQARQAGVDILSKGIRFDAVFTSHLRRAAYTARTALGVCGQDHLPLQHDSRIAERSFGIFAGEPIRLLQLALGYHMYEELMHSAHSAPPLGEPIEAVYARMVSFYEDVVVPLVAAGKNVLVVSHQYALEPLALYLSGLPPHAYRNVNLTNGKALSVQDLRAFMAAEGGGWRAAMQVFGDQAMLLSVAAAPLFWTAGVALSAAAGFILPHVLARALVVLGLAASTFYTLLDVDVPMSFRKLHRGSAGMVALQAAVRAGVACFLLARAATLRSTLQADEALAAEYAFAYATLGALLWLLPPALTTPAMSLMWGGGLYLAVAASITLTVVLPLLIVAAVAIGLMPGMQLSALGFFFAIATAGCAVPAAAAAAARSRWPVASKKHSKSWRWLTAPALWMMAFVAGNMTAPPNMAHGLLGPLWFSGTELRPNAAQPLDAAAKLSHTVHITAVQSFALVAASFLAMRFAALASCGVLAARQSIKAKMGSKAAVQSLTSDHHTDWSDGATNGGSTAAHGDDEEAGLSAHQGPGAPPSKPTSGGAVSGGAGAVRLMELLDVFILLTQPNFFMLAALSASLGEVNGTPIGLWITFWASALFFWLPAIEQAVVVRMFMRRALVRSHDTSVPEEQLRALWDAFASGGPGNGGGGGGGAAAEGPEPLQRVVAAARAMATADSLDPGSPTVQSLERYTAHQLRRHLAGDSGAGGDGIDYSRFARYFQATGGTVNLNVAGSRP